VYRKPLEFLTNELSDEKALSTILYLLRHTTVSESLKLVEHTNTSVNALQLSERGSSVASILVEKEKSVLKLFPNPANDEVTLMINSIPPNGERVKSITVFDGLGREVLNIGYSSSFRIHNLNYGFYFVRVELKDGQVYRTNLFKGN
jgi:hypothetical protein